MAYKAYVVVASFFVTVLCAATSICAVATKATKVNYYASPIWWRDFGIASAAAAAPRSPYSLSGGANVTAFSGDDAFLPCRVERHLAGPTVTWMRKRDLHILTVGEVTFSADRRFKALHPKDSAEWTLHIKSVSSSDAGEYECQVNSASKRSLTVHLKVKEFTLLDDPDTFDKTTAIFVPYIDGPPKVAVTEGAFFRLTCRAKRPHASIAWRREQTVVDVNSSRGGISIQTEQRLSETVSWLSVFRVTPRDSGAYTCEADRATSLPVIVIVERTGSNWAEPMMARRFDDENALTGRQYEDETVSSGMRPSSAVVFILTTFFIIGVNFWTN